MTTNRAALWLLAACLALPACQAPPPTDALRPNLVVVSIDTLNRDALRAFDPRAPALENVDRFADGAARFRNAFSPASWTLPAHASLLTGRYPHRHGAVHPKTVLRDEVPTLAESLRQAGYRTVAFTDGGFVSRRFHLNRGFDLYDDWNAWRLWRSKPDLPRNGRPAESSRQDLFDRADAFLRSWSEDLPLFLFLQTYSVHDYFKVSPTAGRSLGVPSEETLEQCLLGRRRCGGETWTTLQTLYDAEVRRMDRGFGALLDALSTLGDDRPTYTVFVSDHGEGFDAERGHIHHAGRLDDDLLRVPLLIAGPDVEPRDLDAPVSLVDLAPTLLDLAGIESHRELDGRSAAPLVRGEWREGPPEEPRWLFGLEHAFWWRDGERRERSHPRARPLGVVVIAGEHRWLESLSGERLYRTAGGSDAEPTAPGEAPPRERLRRAVADLLADLPPLEERPFDEALAEKLRSLGYL